MEELESEQPAEVKLIVTEEMRSYFYDITKWVKFLSIVGYAVAILLLFVAFNVGSILKSSPEAAAALAPFGKAGSTLVTIIYFAIAAFFFYPSMLMGRIAARGKQAILFGDQENLDSTMLQLKSLFKFWGIITLIMVVFYVLVMFLVATGMAK